MSQICRLALKRTESQARQIEQHYRDLITQGRLRPGARLPSNQALALQLNTSSFTVQTGLAPLVKEGLLVRKPKWGTVVGGRGPLLSCVGIYYGGDLWDHAEAGSYRSIHTALQAQLEAENLHWKLLVDVRPDAEQDSAPLELARAVRSKEIQGLISLCSKPQNLAFLMRLGIPLAHYSSQKSPGQVITDTCQGTTDALAALAAQGCRSVGLISLVPAASPASAFHQTFLTTAAQLGMRTRPEWIQTPGEHLEQGLQGHFGHQAFHKLWSNAEKPDALLVTPDNTAQGVVMAIIELGVHVPQQLKLAMHRHDETPFLCPLRSLWFTTSGKTIADALLTQIRRRMENNAVEPIVIPYRLVQD